MSRALVFTAALAGSAAVMSVVHGSAPRAMAGSASRSIAALAVAAPLERAEDAPTPVAVTPSRGALLPKQQVGVTHAAQGLAPEGSRDSFENALVATAK